MFDELDETEAKEIAFTLAVTALAPALKLNGQEVQLISFLISCDEAPSARRISNELGADRTRVKTMLSKLEVRGFVKITAEGLIDLSGLQEAVNAIPNDEKKKLFEAGLEDA